MNSAKSIEHPGIIKRIEENSVIVSIAQNSGCMSCQAKGSCNITEVEEKEIEVMLVDKDLYPGEHVKVYFKESLGFFALFLGYVLPFLTVIFVLALLTNTGFGEGEAGLIALGSLVPYYFVIYMVRGKLKKTFKFSIKKLENSNLFQKAEIYY